MIVEGIGHIVNTVSSTGQKYVSTDIVTTIRWATKLPEL